MQGRHSPTCVLPRNCTNSLLQQGPGILPIAPTQKWVNKSMPVAKSSDWWLLLLPRTHVLSSSCPQDHEHSLKKDHLQTPIFLLITLCHVGSRPRGSRTLSPGQGQPAGRRKTLQLHPPHHTSMRLSRPARLLFS